MDSFIKNLPKAELHIHFDGALEPEMALTLAEKNKIDLPFNTLEALQKKYHFTVKKDFFTLFLTVAQALRTAEDFYTVMYRYLKKASDQGVIYAEVIFDTQTYYDRGIHPDVVYDGLRAASQQAEKDFGIKSFLMLCFIRELPEAIAFKALQWALPYRDMIKAVDIAGCAEGHPPSKFKNVFKAARDHGFKTAAHAGEEEGAWAVREALDILCVDRIDHGVRAMEDSELVKELAARKTPLTVCPLSNIALKLYPSLSQHPIKKMLEQDLLVSLHSDDPAYFNGYIADNYYACHQELAMTRDELIQCAKNSFLSSFLDENSKLHYCHIVDSYVQNKGSL